MNTDTQTISTEALLQLLAHPRRRTILHHLVENDGEAIALDELTETIATDGGTTTVPHEFGDTRTRGDLYHLHLPKSTAADIIEYNSDDHTVRYHSSNRVEKLLQFVSAELE